MAKGPTSKPSWCMLEGGRDRLFAIRFVGVLRRVPHPLHLWAHTQASRPPVGHRYADIATMLTFIAENISLDRCAAMELQGMRRSRGGSRVTVRWRIEDSLSVRVRVMDSKIQVCGSGPGLSESVHYGENKLSPAPPPGTLSAQTSCG